LQRSVRVGQYKLILYPQIKKVLLYDVENDPLEMHDLASKENSKPVIARLVKRLKELQTETGDELDLADAFPEL
jgi:choline-sulfatase